MGRSSVRKCLSGIRLHMRVESLGLGFLDGLTSRSLGLQARPRCRQGEGAGRGWGRREAGVARDTPTKGDRDTRGGGAALYYDGAGGSTSGNQCENPKPHAQC